MRDDFEKELRSHIEHEADALMTEGAEPARARAEAHRRFGNITASVERRWESRRWMPGERLLQDLRFAFRWMRRAPGFVAVTVFSLAAGIGANTAIFSTADQLLRRPLPVRDPHELRIVLRDSGSLSYPLYQALSRQTVFEEMTAAGGASRLYDIRLEGQESPLAARVQDVDVSYFRVLGVPLAFGRGLAADGEAVVSHSFWRDRMQADPAATGRSVWAAGAQFRVVGVAAREFASDAPGSPTDIWTPIDPARRISPRENFLKIYGRIRPGVTNDRAAAELSALYRSYLGDPVEKPHMLVSNGSGGWRGVGRFLAQPVTMLTWMAALLLLLACLNVANLLLARASARRPEIAARLALGCGRSRLMRQLLTESLLLSGLGAVAGVVVARLGADWMGSLLSLANEDIAVPASLDSRVLFFCAAIAIVSGLVFGIMPAWRASRLNLAGRGSRHRFTVARALLAAQAAISMVLLTGTAMLGRSVWNLLQAPTGMDSASAVIAEVNSLMAVRKPVSKEMMMGLIGRLESSPGVERASLSLFAPLTRSNSDSLFQREDGTEKGMRQTWMMPGYFEALGIRMMRGRTFDISEDAGSAVVLSARAARILFPDSDPLGKIVRGHRGRDPRRVVGIVEDARFDGPRRDPVPMVYEPLAGSGFGFFSVEARVRGDAAAALPGIRKVLEEERQIVRSIRTLPAQIEQTAATDIAVARLSAALGLLSLLVAGIGLHGTMTYTVARRTREIGVRVALGSTGRAILAKVIGEAALIVSAGICAGVPLAIAGRPIVERFLFGVERTDLASFAAAAAILLTVALLAALVPAVRASRVNPVEALRTE